MYFLFSKAGKFKTSIARVPYNKLLTNLASSSRTGEYWPSVVFVRTSLRSVRTATTSGQYSPVRPSRSVSKRLLFQYKDNTKNNDYDNDDDDDDDNDDDDDDDNDNLNYFYNFSEKLSLSSAFSKDLTNSRLHLFSVLTKSVSYTLWQTISIIYRSPK